MRELGAIENEVLFGGGEYLFLANGGHHVLDFSRGLRQVPPESFVNFETNIQERARHAKNHNIRYLHVITPDKQSVLDKQFPFPNPICLGQLYLEHCSSILATTLYPRKLLKDLYEEGTQVFFKTDTHLTDAGSIAVTQSILQKLEENKHQEFTTELLKCLVGVEDYIGDLGSKLNPQLAEPKATFTGSFEQLWFHNGIVGGNNGIVDIRFTKNPRTKDRLLFFGDSFGRELCRFLSIYFGEAVFVRTPYYHIDLVEAIQPSVIVTQNVERYLNYCDLDEHRPLFFMYPFLSGLNYAPSQAFVEAFSAVCSYGRFPYRKYLAAVGYE
jgi:hypothetical protein